MPLTFHKYNCTEFIIYHIGNTGNTQIFPVKNEKINQLEIIENQLKKHRKASNRRLEVPQIEAIILCAFREKYTVFMHTEIAQTVIFCT